MSFAQGSTNAKIGDGACADCGWPIVDLLCNDGLATAEPYAGNDWWAYCSNPTCKNHSPGEAVWQGPVSFDVRERSG